MPRAMHNRSNVLIKNAKFLLPIEVGDTVRFQQDSKLWKPATILSKVDAPNGGTHLRKRAH